MANRYWVGGTATWNNTASTKWSLTSGGAGGAAVPTLADDVFFDAASGAVTVTTAVSPKSCRNLIFTGFVGTFNNAVQLDIYGNLTLGAGMTMLSGVTGDIYFKGSSTQTITSNGVVCAARFIYLGLSGLYSPTVILADAFVFTTTNGRLTLSSGTFNANNQNVTLPAFESAFVSTRTLTMGSGTWTIVGTGSCWNINNTAALTFSANTSTIKFTNSSVTAKTFIGGGLTYNNFWNATGSTGTVTITGSNTFNDIKLDAGRTQRFTAGTTTTLTTLTATGAGITITSATSATHTLSCSSGTIAVQNCTISYSIATGGAIFNAYTSLGNVNAGNNTGWRFISTQGNFLAFM